MTNLEKGETIAIILLVIGIITFLILRWLRHWSAIKNKELDVKFDSKQKEFKDRESYRILEEQLISFRTEVLKKIDAMALSVYSGGMTNESASLHDRLKAGYEYFLLGGNHGAERTFIKDVIFSSPVGKQNWWSLKAEMAREGRVPQTDAANKIFDSIERALH